MQRYRRQGFYDRELKAWKTYHINKNGKIVFDSDKKSYNEVRQVLKKNKVKRKDDLISKKMSLAIAPAIKTRKKWQQQTDRLLKKKRLTDDEKNLLQTLSAKAGYKKKDIAKKTKTYRKKAERKPFNYIQMNILCTFHSTTSTQFYIADKSFKQLKAAVKKLMKQVKTDRLDFEFEGMEGYLNKESFLDEEKFEHDISENLQGYGKIPFSRGKFKIKIKGVKR